MTELTLYNIEETPPCLHCAYGSTGTEKQVDASAAFDRAFTLEDFRSSDHLPDVESLLFTALVPGIDYRRGVLAEAVVAALKTEMGARFPTGFKLFRQGSADNTLIARYNSDRDVFVVGVGVVDFVRTK